VFDVGKSQTTFASSNSAKGVDNTSSDERDDNHSIASSSLSNSSTLYVTESLVPISHASVMQPLSPNSHSSMTEPLTSDSHALIKGLLGSNSGASSGSHEQHHLEHVHCVQDVLQTVNIALGSNESHNIDKHETLVCEEGANEAVKQQAQSRLHVSINFQSDQFTEGKTFQFEPVKIENKRQKTRKNLEKHEKCDERKDNVEVNPFTCVGGHSFERSMDEVQYGSSEELQKEKSYEGKKLVFNFLVVCR